METFNICRICGSRSTHRSYRVKEMMLGTREEFAYFLCADCGCLQIESVPLDLSKYYPANYYSLAAGEKQASYTPYLRTILQRARVGHALFGRRRLFNELAAHVVDLPLEWHHLGPTLKLCAIRRWNTRFLDVGCGSRSWWLESLQALGFKRLVGLDPYIDDDVRYGEIRIRKGQLSDVVGRYDVITLHHSLEHIPDQIGTLQSVRALLAPSGTCLVRVPLVSSEVWDRYGTDWVELDAPRHLYLHSLKSIAAVGQQAGLRLINTTWDSTAFEFFGSEQYRRGIPLMADNSFARNPTLSDFTYREMGHFSALAKQANLDGRGGRGCFLFRRA